MYDNRLKYCRELLNMTQEELGQVLGVSRKTLSNWENGYFIIPIETLINFCNLYNFSVDYIFNLSNINKKCKTKKIDNKTIGQNLKKLRINLNYSQFTIAKECGITQQSYSKYELGKSIISTMTLYTICKNHNISADQILDRD